MSKKWSIPGEITNVRLALDNKIILYKIRTENGNFTNLHRVFIKKIPQNNPETNVPDVIDADDDTDIPEPAETNAAWTRGGRLCVKLSSIHTSEADDLDSTSKLSSNTRSDSAVEYFSSSAFLV